MGLPPASPSGEGLCLTRFLSLSIVGNVLTGRLTERLSGREVTISRLAHVVPVGGELDYLDDGTLSTALKARRPF